jgi:hypothetical protein
MAALLATRVEWLPAAEGITCPPFEFVTAFKGAQHVPPPRPPGVEVEGAKVVAPDRLLVVWRIRSRSPVGWSDWVESSATIWVVKVD